MKKLFAIILATALLVFGATTVSLQAADDPFEGEPEYVLPMPY